MEKKRIAIASYILLILALILGTPHYNDFVIADFLLSKVGAPLWSNGIEGIHYSGIITLIMIIVSLIGFSVCSGEFSSKVKKLAIVTFLFGHLIFEPVFAETYGFIKASMGGLDSVDYLRKSSHSSFKSTPDDKFLKIDCDLTFENYDSEEKRFYIKLIPNEYDLVADKQVVAIDEQTSIDKEFTLLPKSKRTFKATFLAKPEAGVSRASGDFTPDDIVIFNSTKEKEFIRGRY